jgi:hypothetical protein
MKAFLHYIETIDFSKDLTFPCGFIYGTLKLWNLCPIPDREEGSAMDAFFDLMDWEWKNEAFHRSGCCNF